LVLFGYEVTHLQILKSSQNGQYIIYRVEKGVGSNGTNLFFTEILVDRDIELEMVKNHKGVVSSFLG